MPRINLLPWREELRKQRQKNFAAGAVAAVVAAGLVTLLTGFIVQGQIDHQNARNQRLEQEIARLDALIEEIRNLERQKERLLARMEIIEELQRRRPESVHLFDQLARILPDGVFYNVVQQTTNRVEIRGLAESSTRVSALMRNIEDSEWLKEPRLEVVESDDDGGVRRSRFSVSATQVTTEEKVEAMETVAREAQP
ncbi:MAG: PilN domain-containing protein [Gammaproteobacteria bacterium]|nr:MAG: PilN domain-containing protein [Gammaproteobacteria bacterium]